ncbi:hypothetical protein CALCODRAFT_527101 [Calocera cornea HHB12733]|uniref:Retroviral polymerase SH3-like domain-containing protein n=1 Tax=Calocera cornea HHB12733 TaxID=1353952 RepID=A0A165E6C7_9BASI|nr:hypothetical protein CALCODRAFT_527101 [Calocera cornea HHB12733]
MSHLPNSQTPYEVAMGQKPNLTNMLPFEAKVWVKNLNAHKTELQAIEGQFLGFDDASKGYCIYWPGKHRVSVEWDMYPMQNALLDPTAEPMTIEGGGNSDKDTPTINLPDFVNVRQPFHQPTNNKPPEEHELSPLTMPPASTRANLPVQELPIRQPPNCNDGLLPPDENLGQGKRTTHQPG